MNASRQGGVIRALLVLFVVGSLGALTWITIANWRKDGEFSLRPLDPDWWTLSRPATSTATGGGRDQLHRDGQDLTDQAKRLAQDAKESLWGRNGLMERVEGWWSQRATSAPAPADAASDRRRLEGALHDADAAFRAGLDAYRRASPAASGSAEDKRAAVDLAHGHFRRANELLAALEPYERLPDHDVALARSARQLEEYDRQLLEMTASR